MTEPAKDDLVERLRSSEPLPVCPYDRLSPHYWTMPNDRPCPFCGQENTSEGPDKCRGADTRIMGEAADTITALRAEVAALRAQAGSMTEKVRKAVPELVPLSEYEAKAGLATPEQRRDEQA